jgi:thiol-disulfide isomerase/thioredoxin
VLGLPTLLLACDKKALTPALRPGMPLPLVELPVLDGTAHRLGDMSAPCLINFWATWCPPCRAEMASLNRLHKDYAGRGLGVFAVSIDEDAHLIREFVRQVGLELPILLDPGGRVTASVFGVGSFPTSFLVDHQARVSNIWIGERNWDAADIRAAMDQLIRR